MLRGMPVLQVADVARSEAFYRDALGFRSHGSWGDPPAFAIVQRGRVTIALDCSRGGAPVPDNQYWAAYLYIEDADALAEEFRRRGVAILRGPSTHFQDWVYRMTSYQGFRLGAWSAVMWTITRAARRNPKASIARPKGSRGFRPDVVSGAHRCSGIAFAPLPSRTKASAIRRCTQS